MRQGAPRRAVERCVTSVARHDWFATRDRVPTATADRTPSATADRTPRAMAARTAHPTATPHRDRSLTAELERRGFVLHGRIAAPDLPTIDHVVVARSGVWLVARTHVHCARVSVRPRLTGRSSLRVGGRDRTALVDDLSRQVTAVRGALYDALDVPVRAALCLPGAEFPLLRTLTIDDHLVVRPGQLLEHIGRRGPLTRTRGRSITAKLDARLG